MILEKTDPTMMVFLIGGKKCTNCGMNWSAVIARSILTITPWRIFNI
jgi:hypothetical protein